MKHLRYLLMAALVAMPLTACDEDDETVVEPVTITGTVSGTVSVEGAGLQGVTVTLVGVTSQTATTGAGGTYTFTGVEAGSYGVTISSIPAGVSFSTTSATTSITTQGQTVTVVIPALNCTKWQGFRGKILAAPSRPACRSQMDIQIDGDWRKLLTDQVGFHVQIVYGDYLREVGYALKKLGKIEWEDFSDTV